MKNTKTIFWRNEFFCTVKIREKGLFIVAATKTLRGKKEAERERIKKQEKAKKMAFGCKISGFVTK